MSNDKHYPLHPNATHPPIMTCEIPLEEYESLKRENAELKAKLESVQATAYTDSVDAGMEIRRLKRALYKACANWAHEKDGRYYLKYVCISDYARIQYERWRRMERKCRAKAEAYK